MKTLYFLVSLLLTVSLAYGAETAPADSEPSVSSVTDPSGEELIDEMESECTDFPDFKDRAGYSCASYTSNPTRWCNDRWTNSDGVSPIEACCVCGGGSTDDEPASFEGDYYIKSLPFGNYLRFYPLYGWDNKVVDMTTKYKDSWEEIAIVPVPNRNKPTYYIKSGYFNDIYLSVDPQSGALTRTSSGTSDGEFRIFSRQNDQGGVRFRHVKSGKRLSAEDGDYGKVSMTDTRSSDTLFVLEGRESPTAAPSEVPNDNPPTPHEGIFYIKSRPFENYLSIWGSNSSFTMYPGTGQWEKMEILAVPGKRLYYIKSVFNNKYLSVDPGSNDVTRSESAGRDEEFRIVPRPNGVFIRHAKTGKFLLAVVSGSPVSLSDFQSTKGTLFVLEDASATMIA